MKWLKNLKEQYKVNSEIYKTMKKNEEFQNKNNLDSVKHIKSFVNLKDFPLKKSTKQSKWRKK